MIDKGKFFVVTSDLLSLSYFSSFRKEGVSIEIVPTIDSVLKELSVLSDTNSVMVLVDISTDDTIFDNLQTLTSVFPSKQVLCFSETIELEHIRKSKELSIPSVVTKNDFQKLFALLIT